VDLVDHPELAADPQWAFATAGLFWKSNGLNELADKPDFVAITKRINGGTNGLADRQMYYERAKKVLGDNFIAADFSTPKAVPEAVKTRGVPKAVEPMERGHEAIAEDHAQHHRKPHP
jgi:hypothetical protein